MAEYTPTLRTLRVAWVAHAAPDSTAEVHRLQAMFDRAVAAHECEVRRQVAAEVRAEVEGWDRTGGSYARGKHRMYNLLADRIERGA